MDLPSTSWQNNWQKCVTRSGRIVYMDHSTQTSYWVPPSAHWRCSFGLPYGWEIAVDTAGKLYYINHIEEKSTYCDPRANVELEAPEPRQVVIKRHSELGYGFVAGSEKPVIIRFVTEGGPSIDKLLPGDEILAVNDENVIEASKEHVVNLVRSCSNDVKLTVCQPRTLDSNLKSAILSASKRARLKHNPSRVRFAEGVFLGPDVPNGSESCVPFMPNVMRVFLENGQTRSFKYDLNTTVQDVLESLREKLALQTLDNFALMLEHPQGPRSNKLSLLKKDEKLCRIAARPGSQHFRCLLRVAFVPSDPLELHKTDPIAFEYYYQQCVNDVVAGRHAYEMRYEACVRLSALQMQQIALDTKICQPGAKISLKVMEKEYGLNSFLPVILLENVKRKEIRKHLRFYLKRDTDRRNSSSQTANCITNSNANVIANSVSNSSNINIPLDPSLALRIRYVNMLGHLPTFGGRTFCVTFRDTKTDMLMQIHPKQGMLLKGTGRTTEPAITIHFDLMTQLLVTTETDVLKLLTIHLKTGNASSQTLEFLIDKDDIEDLVLYTQGYYALLLHQKLPCQSDDYKPPSPTNSPVPPYHGFHSVRPAGWNYEVEEDSVAHSECLVDLSRGPPPYPGSVEIPESSNKKVQFGIGVPEEDDETISESVPLLVEEVSVEIHNEDMPKLDENEGHFKPVKGKLRQPQQVSWIGKSQSKKEDEFTPKTFLRAKDSILVREYKPQVDDYKPKTFLQAKDSLLVKHRDRLATYPLMKKVEREQSLDESDGMEKITSSELSSSDTESQSTPNESPIHRPAIKQRPNELPTRSDSTQHPSFGLKSPDNLPCNMLTDNDIQDIVSSCSVEGRTLEELLLLFPDNLCTDSEIIDLTLLPSPSTQVEPGACDPFALSDLTPPTPFRDDQDPKEQFQEVMDRLEEGDVQVIEDSHQKATKRCRKKVHTSEPINSDPISSSPFSSTYPSINRNRREFEQFLVNYTIPPPPKFSLDSSRQALATACEPSRRVRFSSNLLRKRSNSGDIESLLARERKLHSIAEEKLIQVASKRLSNSPTYPRNAMSDEEDSKQDWIEFLQSQQPPEKKSSQIEKQQSVDDVRMVSLKKFSGLELSEHEPPQVQRMPLKEFVGLEVLERGIASIEVREQPIPQNREARMSFPNTASERRKLMARIRSVDPHPDPAPSNPGPPPANTSRKISANKIVLACPPLKSIAETGHSPTEETPHYSSTHLEKATDSTKVVGNGFVPEGQEPKVSVDSESTAQALDQMKEQMNAAMNNMPSRSPKRIQPEVIQQTKIRLLTESQQFASATKLLVQSATEICSEAHMKSCLARSLSKAKTMSNAAEALVRSSPSLFKAQILSAKITEVLNAFGCTVESLVEARGKELGDPYMKKFMRQSTTLAATLTQLIQAVRDA